MSEEASSLILFFVAIVVLGFGFKSCREEHEVIDNCSITTQLTRYKDYSYQMDNIEVPWKYSLRAFKGSESRGHFSVVYEDLTLENATKLCELEKKRSE